MTDEQITSPHWAWLPGVPQWGNFAKLFSDSTATPSPTPSPMLTGLGNSAVIAVVTLVLQMLFSSMAGYALARIPARGRGVVFSRDPGDADDPKRRDLRTDLSP